MGIVTLEDAVDGGLEICGGSEHASLETPLGQDGEKALDGVDLARTMHRVERCAARLASFSGSVAVFVDLRTRLLVSGGDAGVLGGRGLRADGRSLIFGAACAPSLP